MSKKKSSEPSVLRLPAFDDESETLNAIVETPAHSRNKFAFDRASSLYRLSAVLPEGASFPHAFGFVPSTLGDDGDPLDVMILMDEPVYPGCLVPARLLGVIEARQTDADGAEEENDRLVAVSVESRRYAETKWPDDLSEEFKTEIEQFFVFYNEARGKKFEVRGWKGQRAAERLVQDGEKRLRKSRRKRAK